jgi:hypothetical protein
LKRDLQDKPDASRRMLVGGIAAGAAAIAARGEAKAAAPTGQPETPPLKQDPVTQYPAPPFKRQEQEWPGLASKMEPRPDHGETTYKGSGRLAGRKALITGGDSGMGRAAAIALPAKAPTWRSTTSRPRSRTRGRWSA